jgi:dCMP deaminase
MEIGYFEIFITKKTQISKEFTKSLIKVMIMIIGLTGTNAAGKTTINDYLISKNFENHSLSDILREELSRSGLEHTRENLIHIGNELREKHGASVLADRIKSKLSSKNTVIDSIRNPSEVESLRQLENFFLIAVDAPVEIRYQRAISRKRIENVTNIDEFIEIENREKSLDSNYQNIVACMEQADFKIENNGELDELKEKVDNIITQIKNSVRPSWDEYFLKMAFLVAERSTCLRHHVGAIIIKDRYVLTTGYNGAARNIDDCLKLGCLRNQLNIPSGERHEICRAIHAEQNAIIQAGVHGVNIDDGTLYCTHGPCIICAKMIVNAGIKRVVTCGEYPDDFNLVINLFEQAGVEFNRINRPDMAIKCLP